MLSIRACVSSRTRLASSLLVILSARHSPRGFRTITRKLSRLLRRSGGSRVNKERSRDRGTGEGVDDPLIAGRWHDLDAEAPRSVLVRVGEGIAPDCPMRARAAHPFVSAE